MTGPAASGRTSPLWYARPVVFVTDVPAALRFYVDLLGFDTRWHGPDGSVCQVDRGGCEIILCRDDTRRDRARLFVELDRVGMGQWRREIAERAIPTERAWWGYDVIRVVDPDGNELLFPLDASNEDEAER